MGEGDFQDGTGCLGPVHRGVGGGGLLEACFQEKQSETTYIGSTDHYFLGSVENQTEKYSTEQNGYRMTETVPRNTSNRN